MMLRGYRSTDHRLLAGPWLAGELLGLPLADAPELFTTRVEPPRDATVELCVVEQAAFVRFTELDWVHRRARLEIGVQPGAEETVGVLLKTAVSHGFRVLNLHRLHGAVTPAATPAAGTPVAAILTEAGFRREATIPDGVWYAGAPADREIWGAVRDE
jgi:hypothetical protein